MQPAKFYHLLTLHHGEHFTDKVIPSAAQTIDEAARERCQIAARYNQNAIAALTTHNAGTGPACKHD